MLSGAVQVLAFGLALLGVVGATVATLLPNWKVSAAPRGGVMAPLSQMQGLWTDCVWFSAGVFSCTVKDSVLSLPPSLHLLRAGMVLGCALAALGLCLAALGLKCTRWGGGQRAKGHTAVAAGGCFVLAALLCLVPAALFTREVIAAFLTSDLPDSSKYQPGGALCVAFVSAGFLLAGGVVFCLSCPGSGSRRPDGVSSCNEQPRLERKKPENEKKKKSVRLQTDGVRLQTDGVRPERRLFAQADLRDNYSLQEYV